MKYIGNVQSQANAEVFAVASGVLPGGKPVVVNSNGTVSVIAGSTTSGETTSPTQINTTTGGNSKAIYDTANNRVVIVYREYAVVATVAADNSLSFGTPVAFNSGGTDVYGNTGAYDSVNGKILVAWRFNGSGGGIFSRVGTVDTSDNSISFGSIATAQSNTGTGPVQLVSTYDPDQQRFILSIRDQSNNYYGTMFLGTVSGTSISFGNAIIYNAASTINAALCYDTTSNRLIVAFRNAPAVGYALVGTVSSSSVSFGSTTTFINSTAGCIEVVHDSTNNKNIIFYLGGINDGYAVVQTVNASNNSATYGTAAQFEGGGTGGSGTAAFNAAAGKADVFYKDEGDSNKQKFSTGTVSGTSITFTTPVVYDSTSGGGDAKAMSAVYNSTAENIFLTYYVTNSRKALIQQLSFTSTNLTSENFIGFADGEATFSGGVQVLGDAVEFEDADIAYASITYDTNSDRAVITYRDDGNSSYGTAIVAEISGSTISFGTPEIFNTGGSNYISSTFDSNSNRVVVAYTDTGNSSAGTVVVGSVTASDNSITFGSEAVFNNANTLMQESVSTAFDSDKNRVVIVYRDNGNSNVGTAIVGNVNPANNSITFGSEEVFKNAAARYMAVTFDETNNKILVAYDENASPLAGFCIVGTVTASDNSITFGSETAFNGTNASNAPKALIYDPVSAKNVMIRADGNNSEKGTAVVVSISGTTPSFGTAVVFQEGHVDFK